MSAVSSVTNNATNTNATESILPQQTLSQNDFLKLLIAQMTAQDPLNPQTDTQMAAQMAQFTSLQQSGTMASDLQILKANSMLGGTVSVQTDANTVTTGVVETVRYVDGTPQIVVGGVAYEMSQILAISPTPVATP
jgi:flagellar basal-body rod modification protein FlgD